MPDKLPGTRSADEAIYLAEDRRERPKQVFVEMADLIAERQWRADTRLLDVGCATGELITYLRDRFPDFRLSGMDISPPMIEVARSRNPEAEFHCGNVEVADSYPPKTADIVLMSGVLDIFDEARPAISNLVQWTAPGGRVIILDITNDEPVDVIVRHRRVGERAGPWELGWNIFSKAGLELILRGLPRVKAWRFAPFGMPFALPKREDPMRTWTMATEHNPFQLVNGARQLVDLSFLIVDLD